MSHLLHHQASFRADDSRQCEGLILPFFLLPSLSLAASFLPSLSLSPPPSFLPFIPQRLTESPMNGHLCAPGNRFLHSSGLELPDPMEVRPCSRSVLTVTEARALSCPPMNVDSGPAQPVPVTGLVHLGEHAAICFLRCKTLALPVYLFRSLSVATVSVKTNSKASSSVPCSARLS